MWVSEVSGRESVGKLAKTGGVEWDEGNRKLETYKPGFLKLQVKQGGGEWGVERQGELPVIRQRGQEGSQAGAGQPGSGAG